MKMSKDEEKFYNDNVVDFDKGKKAKQTAKGILNGAKQYGVESKKEIKEEASGYRYWFPELDEVSVSSDATKKIEEAHHEQADKYIQYLLHLINTGNFGITSEVEDSCNMFSVAFGGVVNARYPYDPNLDRDKTTKDDMILVSLSKCKTMCFLCMEYELIEDKS
mgnify:CR=1 FL=1|tara:strand:- start:417 stop:908 length:492 start_codon:yes stop_codon:yes gene_type:complete